MSETKLNLTREIIKEKLNGVTKSWRAEETFTGDSTDRLYGYFPADMGANIKALEERIYKLVIEFETATKCKVSQVMVQNYTYRDPAYNTLNVEVTVAAK